MRIFEIFSTLFNQIHHNVIDDSERFTLGILGFLLATRVSSSHSKRTRRTSNTHEKNNESILDEEYLIELLKRLKQQAFDNYSNLFDTLISKSFPRIILSPPLFRTLSHIY